MWPPELARACIARDTRPVRSPARAAALRRIRSAHRSHRLSGPENRRICYARRLLYRSTKDPCAAGSALSRPPREIGAQSRTRHEHCRRRRYFDIGCRRCRGTRCVVGPIVVRVFWLGNSLPKLRPRPSQSLHARAPRHGSGARSPWRVSYLPYALPGSGDRSRGRRTSHRYAGRSWPAAGLAPGHTTPLRAGARHPVRCRVAALSPRRRQGNHA